MRTGWTPKLEDQYYVTAIVKNKSGEEFYKLEGKYTKLISLIDLKTG